MLLGPLGQNRGKNCIEDGSSATFPRTVPTLVYSLVNCDVEKQNYDWGKAAEEGLMEAARFS